MAVFHATPRPSATRATVRCWTTIPSSAHRSPRRDSFARGSAAVLVSWRHTCPQLGAPVAAHDNLQQRSAASRAARAPTGGPRCHARDPSQPQRSAPLVGLDDPAGQHSTVGFEALAGDDKAELVKPAEGGQVRAAAKVASGTSRSSGWAV